MRRHAWTQALAAVLLAATGFSAEVVIEPIARISEAGKILECLGVVCSADGKGLLVGVAESDAKQGLVAYQVYEVGVGGKTTRLFRTQLPKAKEKREFLPGELQGMAANTHGELFLAGQFVAGFSTIRKVANTGEVLREVPYPDEVTARAESPRILSMAMTERDELLTVSGETILYGRDLTRKWQLPQRYHTASTAVYDRKRQQFIVACRGGQLDKFGMPADDKPSVLVLVVDSNGKVTKEAMFAGMTPHLAVSGSEYLLLRDTAQGGDGRFILTRLAGDLTEIESHALADMPAPMLPSVYPLRLCARSNGSIVAIGNAVATLFVREWDAKGNIVRKKDPLWFAPDNGMWLDMEGDEVRIVSGEVVPTDEESENGLVRVDRIKFK